MIIMEENVIVIRDSETSYFDFDWPKDVEIEFMKLNLS